MAETVAADEAENGAEKTKVPCEFCNEPCSLEALMRHQVKIIHTPLHLSHIGYRVLYSTNLFVIVLYNLSSRCGTSP